MNKEKIKNALRHALKTDQATPRAQKRPKRTPVLIAIIMCLFIFGLSYSTSVFKSPQQEPVNITTIPPVETPPEADTKPTGNIIAPVTGTTTGNNVTVIIETKNLELGTCVWLAVDKPDLGLCWPKAHRIEPNTKVQVQILEEGPKESYRLSLYTLNEYFDNQWQDWIDHKMFGGLHMPPDSKRLASVTLTLGP